MKPKAEPKARGLRLLQRPILPCHRHADGVSRHVVAFSAAESLQRFIALRVQQFDLDPASTLPDVPDVEEELNIAITQLNRLGGDVAGSLPVGRLQTGKAIQSQRRKAHTRSPVAKGTLP